MYQVIIVHFLGIDYVTVLFLAQVLWVDSIGSEKFSVRHTESLTDGLGNELCLWEGLVGKNYLTFLLQ